ncbi:MAG: acetyl-CoA carboxylase biotin carboxyl carrier protein, partial [Planctomycetales bacterium]|nr:acetyl-CoA carboxylase biotin carboxyl carrier protein [Planctomycetales bacterium]NIM07790.1 acetyl-CoA carboxylase biotin carboxyl carrier protein [Planctomycetales bacterium]NIN07936.1 acetyl-CoA carboxylase biotin carboxyl carrier protein [Planctomycetales bacterium]NIN76376.1 acetyl-CoA carboxylase biotin carboxyl carrier protein [Planctomycetales bacterium]NIP04114.1 acetyl-CoA carboxylase biotin carboxyl carrier protein [Planctomycetales bacterium]
GSDFDELKLEMGDVKLELRRRGATAPAPAAPPAPAAAPAPASTAVKTEAVAAPVVASGGGSEVPAPLLGTFYRAPKPGADPFVAVGDRVSEDSVIGIIEVMKLMNSVTAGKAGTVTEILAENGELVEHGQALIRIQTD